MIIFTFVDKGGINAPKNKTQQGFWSNNIPTTNYALIRNRTMNLINFSNRLILAVLATLPLTTKADNVWSYHQEIDNLSNQSFSYAQSPLPLPGLYDYLRLELVCKGNSLQATIEANDLITSQSKRFNVDYQIDKMPAISISMKTLPDSKRKGYTEEYAKKLAEDILTGQTLFIHVNTIIRTVLSSSLPLTNADLAVKQVLSDCKLSASNESKATYSLAEFEQQFSQLSLDKQQRVLAELKKIMADIK